MGSSVLELMFLIIIDEGVGGSKSFRDLLLMSKPKLVLQDLLAVRQELNFVCEDVEVVSQGFDELLIIDVIEGHDVQR